MALSQAPAGGCLCFGAWYEGGQFLPEAPDREQAVRISPAAQKFAEDRAARLVRDRTLSTHLHEIGQRVTFPVTVCAVIVLDGFYGPTFRTIARTQGGCVVVSKGARWGKVGDDLTITATIKAHDEYEGVKQTIVQRVKISE